MTNLNALIREGRFEEAIPLADPRMADYLRSIRATIGAAKSLSDPRAKAALERISLLSKAWVENAPPIPVGDLDAETVFLRTLKGWGFYQTPPIDHQEAVSRTLNRQYFDAAWDHLRPFIPKVKRAFEVGPAEGFYTTKLVEHGIAVMAADRDPLAAVRAATFASLNQLKNVTIRCASLSVAAPYVTPKPDIIIALGVIYHFLPLIENLKHLTEFRRPILFEFNAGYPCETFDPSTYQDNQGVPVWWLRKWLDEEGFDSTHNSDWNAVAHRLSGHLPNQEIVYAVPR